MKETIETEDDTHPLSMSLSSKFFNTLRHSNSSCSVLMGHSNSPRLSSTLPTQSRVTSFTLMKKMAVSKSANGIVDERSEDDGGSTCSSTLRESSGAASATPSQLGGCGSGSEELDEVSEEYEGNQQSTVVADIGYQARRPALSTGGTYTSENSTADTDEILQFEDEVEHSPAHVPRSISHDNPSEASEESEDVMRLRATYVQQELDVRLKSTHFRDALRYVRSLHLINASRPLGCLITLPSFSSTLRVLQAAQERAITLFHDLEQSRKRIDLTINSTHVIPGSSAKADVHGEGKVELGSSLFDMSYSANYPPPHCDEELSIIPPEHLKAITPNSSKVIKEADELLSSFRPTMISLQI